MNVYELVQLDTIIQYVNPTIIIIVKDGEFVWMIGDLSRLNRWTD